MALWILSIIYKRSKSPYPYFVAKNSLFTYGSITRRGRLSLAGQQSFCPFATFPLPREFPRKLSFAFPLVAENSENVEKHFICLDE